MATITKQTIKVDLTPGRVYPVLHVSQGDVGLESLEFYIYQNGQPYPIPSEVTAINIDGMTPVGVFSYACTWTGNIVTAGVTATMTAERGIDICELALYDATNNKVGTCNFIIAVEESPFTNAHVSDSDMATIMAAATEVQQNALLSKSWAVGDTGIRTGENTNNSEYWAELSESWAVGDTGKRTGEDTNNSEYWSTVSHQYANTISFKTYDTVAQMKADTGLLDGGVCRTLGKEVIDDNGGLFYKIVTAAPASGLYENLSNGLFAVAMTDEFVTPQMFGAVADAKYLNNGTWYADSAKTIPATDNAEAFQAAIDSGKPVLVPVGSYYLSEAILINRSGTVLTGVGSEENGSVLRIHGSNAITIASGTRLITVERLCITTDVYSNAAIEISEQGDSDGYVHFLTIREIFALNFKYGLCIGGYSATDTQDENTTLWNCSFEDIKINTFDTGENYAIRIFPNPYTHFGLIFKRVVTIGYKHCVRVEHTSAEFISCNFGLNAIEAIVLTSSSSGKFTCCNFECDSKVTSTTGLEALIVSTFRTTFISCGFTAYTDNKTCFIGGGVSSRFVFTGCMYKQKTGNEMANVFSQGLVSAKYSIVFNGGNVEFPRPTPYRARKLQLLDLENSILPHKTYDAEEGTVYLGETQYDVNERTGKRPVWCDGSNWYGGVLGEWKYLDGVAAGASATYTIQHFDDRPRTCLVTARGNNNEVYAIGLLSVYRGAALATFVPINSNKCTISANNLVITVTNNSSSTQYMYLSLVDLM